jgi:hypothetical protein
MKGAFSHCSGLQVWENDNPAADRRLGQKSNLKREAGSMPEDVFPIGYGPNLNEMKRE